MGVGATLLLGVAGVAGVAVAAGCDATVDSAEPWAQLDAGVEHSRWEELDAQGRRLVRETGTLQVLGLSAGSGSGSGGSGSGSLSHRASPACQPLRWVLRLSHAQGRRDYQGVSSSQVPIQTSSAISRHMAQLLALQALTQAWSVAGRLSYRQTLREIADSGSALETTRGYPERYTDWQAAAAVHYAADMSPSLRWGAEVWLGAGPGGSLRLRLPQADPAWLSLGRSRLVQLGWVVENTEKAAADGDLRSGWSGQLRLDYLVEQFGSGAGAVIRRQGIPVGGAAQPATRQAALSVQAALRYRF